jgi:succinate dehydrogenase/fumarate reductase flavoprotein subunit
MPDSGITRRSVLSAGSAASAVLATRSSVMAGQLPAGRKAETCDIVIVGSGMAGLCAALEASASGARTVVLEKMPSDRGGGNSRVAGGLITVPSAAAPAARQDYVDDLDRKTLRRGNVALFKLLADHALDDVAWLQEQGAELLAPTPFAPYRAHAIQVAPAQFAGMPKLMDTLRDGLVRRGGRIVYDTKAKELILDERARAAGVRAVDPDGVTDYRAGAVVLATGGYAGNQEILETFVDPDAGGMVVRGVPWATGDGLLMARAVGAGLANMGGLTSLHVAAVSRTDPRSGIPDRGLPYCISVNRDGRRFLDEANGYVANGKAALKQPGQTVAFIFDAEIAKEPRVKTSIDVFQRLGLPIIAADTVAELAARMDMPPVALGATIDDFNRAVQDGKALGATPPKREFARPIEHPKFYAFFPLVPGIAMTFGGIMINTSAQVVEADGRIIGGLYAAGEVTGGEFYDDYIGGCMLTKCLVMGRIAGRLAAAERS